ncbi:hypothetical protein AB0L53_28330 [Nonomuraea sp. NPDC052129]|uniref:hypothetical protein n=1 Tax=Nonomuraea sp. NPDC052129 TaxID=3154651 RepID=UPI00343E5F8C
MTRALKDAITGRLGNILTVLTRIQTTMRYCATTSSKPSVSRDASSAMHAVKPSSTGEDGDANPMVGAANPARILERRWR